MKEEEMNDEKEKTPEGRQTQEPYQPPRVTRVSLRPEEAVLGHCKVTGAAGPVSGSCRSVVACRSIGS
jgi:hypothetical protein